MCIRPAFTFNRSRLAAGLGLATARLTPMLSVCCPPCPSLVRQPCCCAVVWYWRCGAGSVLRLDHHAHHRKATQRAVPAGPQARPLRRQRINGAGGHHDLRPPRRRQNRSNASGASRAARTAAQDIAHARIAPQAPPRKPPTGDTASMPSDARPLHHTPIFRPSRARLAPARAECWAS